jgi:hypothetical protein
MEPVATKTCTICHEEKDEDQYYYRTGAHLKRVSRCIPCLNVYRLRLAREARARRGRPNGFASMGVDKIKEIKDMIAAKTKLCDISMKVGISYCRLLSYRKAKLI